MFSSSLKLVFEVPPLRQRDPLFMSVAYVRLFTLVFGTHGPFSGGRDPSFCPFVFSRSIVLHIFEPVARGHNSTEGAE